MELKYSRGKHPIVTINTLYILVFIRDIVTLKVLFVLNGFPESKDSERTVELAKEQRGI